MLPAPYRAPQSSSGQLPSWSGYLLDHENIGATLAPDDPICIIASPQESELERARQNLGESSVKPIRVQLDAELVVDQADIELIKPGNKVEVCLKLMPSKVYDTQIRQISYTHHNKARRIYRVSPVVSLGRLWMVRGRVVPVSTSYYARANIESTGGMLYQADLRGRARVYPNQKRSLGWRLYRYVARTFHFAM